MPTTNASPGGTPVQLGVNGSLDGWPALVFVFGLLLTIVLYVRKVKGAILISILQLSLTRGRNAF